MMHYLHVFFVNFFAWAIVIFVIVFVVSALSDLNARVSNALKQDRTPNAETPSVNETLAAIEYASARNIKQRRN